MYKLDSVEANHGEDDSVRPQLLGSGTILTEVRRAAELLADQFGVSSDVWSVTSYCRLRRDALAAERWNRFHPNEERRTSYLEQQLAEVAGPIIAATDYMRTVPDQIARWVPGAFTSLGTDGFGRSDTRSALRDHFEVSAEQIALAALSALADGADIDGKRVSRAIEKLGIDPEKPDPATA